MPITQVDKVVQLYEVMMTRHTTMVVGQTGGGKTVILNTLARTQTKLGKKTTLFTINPKAISVSELYGVLDPDTRDWTDGLLSNIFREINKPLSADKDEARCVECVLQAIRGGGATRAGGGRHAVLYCLSDATAMYTSGCFAAQLLRVDHCVSCVMLSATTQVPGIRRRRGCGVGGEYE
jgi:KaiC/GvpD/RAD55 family RecA-like ATPase